MIKKIYPLLAAFLITCLIFFKIFLHGLYPIPGDLLVSFYFPWYSGGWDGYNPWTTHKELFDADSVRQIYIWKEFAMDQFKRGEVPLWNPYTFSGQPLLANFQSGVFYPLNALYFLTDAKNAWLLLVILQPLLGGLFMYLAIRTFKVSKTASYFGATAFMLSSYLITWMENVNIGHSYIWLPLIFFSTNKYAELKKTKYLFLLLISLSLSVLAGHPQTAIYIYLTTFIFFIFKMSFSLKSIIKICELFFLSLTLCAIQLIPTYSFYKDSPISLPFSTQVFDRSILPIQNLVTFFASDFFGNPATNNFWSVTYGDFTPYFGVIPLIFALWASLYFWKRKDIKFLAVTSVFFVLAAIPGPITYLIKIFKIPLLNSTTPSRFVSISIFLFVILAAVGFDSFFNNLKGHKYQKSFFKFLLIITSIYIFFWTFALIGPYLLSPKGVWQINLKTTARNLVIPTSLVILLLSINISLLFIKRMQRFKQVFIAIIFIATIGSGIYFTNKFLPVSPKKFIFPDHPLFEWLNQNAGINRFYGQETAHIDFNFPAHYQIFGSEGYDTLRFKSYAELLASGFNGQVPETYLRSDAVFANTENDFRKRLFEILGVKYLIDKEDNPKTGADWHYERFQNDQITGIWQQGKAQIYERTTVLPRIFMTGKYIIASSKDEIIQKIYDKNFNLETLILEEKPKVEPDPSQEISQPNVIAYNPNTINLTTHNPKNSLLFISDAYSADWIATVDGIKTPILKTDYALRSIALPNGDHSVTFQYRPLSFTIGWQISLLSLIVFFLLAVKDIRKKQF